MHELDDILVEFIAESYEHLDHLDAQLVELEHHSDPAVLAGIFRAVHTIKGTSGFLGLSTLETVTHVGEGLLVKLRDGELDVTEEHTTALLTMVDAVRSIVTSVEQQGTEGDDDHGRIVATLEALSQEPVTAPDPISPQPLRIGELLLSEGLVTEAQLAAALALQAGGDPRRIGELLVETADLAPTVIADALREQSERIRGAESIRVEVARLDMLRHLVGELAMSCTEIRSLAATSHDPALTVSAQRLDRITADLDAAVLRTLMQPVELAWAKFVRVVRDLALAGDKQARVEMSGTEIELDRGLIDAIRDPLTHLVRNAVDHGLEAPEARLAAGKPAEGVVALRASDHGDHVVITVADDGRGIDVARLRCVAIERGILSPGAAASLGDDAVLDLIFVAGVSTASSASKISGRGVGMDVVRNGIEGLGGSIAVHTVHGAGTTFVITIPIGASPSAAAR